MPELTEEVTLALVPITDDDPSEAARALTPIQREALSLLLAGETQAAAAAAIGRSERTLRYWVLQPHFRRAMREGNDARLKEACSLLGARSVWAILRLQQLAQDDKVSGHAQVAAAKALVQLTLKSYVPRDQSEDICDIREQLRIIRVNAGVEEPAPEDEREW